jgi:hypothetical protein
MAKARKEAKRKLPKGVDEDMAQDIERLSTDELKAKIVELAKGLDEVEEFKKSQPYLDAKSDFDMVAGPARDSAAAIRGKTKFVVETLKAKGGA